MAEKSSTSDGNSDVHGHCSDATTLTSLSDSESEWESDSDTEDEDQMTQKPLSLPLRKKLKCRRGGLKRKRRTPRKNCSGKPTIEKFAIHVPDEPAKDIKIPKEECPVVHLYKGGPALVKGRVYISANEESGLQLLKFDGSCFRRFNFEDLDDLVVKGEASATPKNCDG